MALFWFGWYEAGGKGAKKKEGRRQELNRKGMTNKLKRGEDSAAQLNAQVEIAVW